MRPHRRQPTRLCLPWDSPGKNTGVGCQCLLHCVKVKNESEVAQSRPTCSGPHGLQPTRLLHPWDFSGTSTGEGCHLLLLGPCYPVLYFVHICMKCSLGISNFLKEISSLSHSIDYLFLFIVHSRKFHISSCYSLELCIQLCISFPLYFAFGFSSFLSFM